MVKYELILELIEQGIENPNLFSSLRINKRKPHTDRLFIKVPNSDSRLCLHTFQKCTETEVFPHPHSWSSWIYVLKGLYRHRVWNGIPLDKKAIDYYQLNNYEPVEHILTTGSMYSITDPYTWHSVQPLTECKSIMINTKTWEIKSDFCVFTKGKELFEVPKEEKIVQLKEFKKLYKNSVKMIKKWI